MAFVDAATGKVEKTITGLGERPWGVQIDRPTARSSS